MRSTRNGLHAALKVITGSTGTDGRAARTGGARGSKGARVQGPTATYRTHARPGLEDSMTF